MMSLQWKFKSSFKVPLQAKSCDYRRHPQFSISFLGINI
jgi:hypothetical protein